MSAIVGIYYLDGRPVDPLDLDRMMNRLAHRGPDGKAVWIKGPVAMGHLMLHTTPESLHEKQPLVSRDGALVLTADARIDNRDELLQVLQVPRSKDRPVTDSDLILAAYEKWGADCTEKLIGDFAFAIWDERARRLFCARDPFVVKPFFYHYVEGKAFYFATEIKALLELAEVPVALNDRDIARHLAVPIYPSGKETAYKDIFALEAAHHALISESGMQQQCYWTMDPHSALRLKSDAEYAEGFRAHFEESVRCRVRSAFPVGSMLSGGLDSSSIASTAATIFAKEGAGRRLHTYSAVYENQSRSDERPYINSVLEKYNVEPHYYYADAVSPLVDREAMLWHEDGIVSGNIHLSWNLYKEASANGVRVIMDGYDGDTVVSHGIGYFSELAYQRRLLKLSLEVKAFAQKVTGQPWRPAVMMWLWQFGFNPALSRLRLLGLWKRLQRLKAPAPSEQPVSEREVDWTLGLNPDFVKQMRPHIAKPSGTLRTEREQHHELLLDAMTGHSCEHLDAFGGAFSVEPRFPFFDRRLVTYCLSLPAEQKIRRGLTRLVLRRAMKGILPDMIQTRIDKSNLEHGLVYAMQTFEQDRFEKMLNKGGDLISNYYDLDVLKEIYQRLDGKKTKRIERYQLFGALYLYNWLEFTQRTSVSDVIAAKSP